MPLSEKFWESVATQVPALCVFTIALILIVKAFLAEMKSIRDSFVGSIDKLNTDSSKDEDRRMETVKELGRDCHAFQERFAGKIQTALDRNSEALGRNESAFDRFVAQLNKQTGA